jgi:hypothetical protein
MGKLIDLTKQRFVRLVVLSRQPNSRDGKAMWLCRCDCGKTRIVVGKDLRNNHTKSCGCLQKEKARKRLTKHSESKQAKEYSIWCNIKNRCNNKNDINYVYYGARGIKICNRWKNSFIDFLTDMGRAPSKHHTVDRINNNSDYKPSNCRWATRKEQSNNKRNNIMIGDETLAQYCRRTNKKYSTIKSRIYRGYSINEAIQ